MGKYIFYNIYIYILFLPIVEVKCVNTDCIMAYSKEGLYCLGNLKPYLDVLYFLVTDLLCKGSKSYIQ